MAILDAAGKFSVAAHGADGACLVLDSAHRGRFVISGYRGTPLPGVVTDPQLSLRDAAGSPSRWSLACSEGTFDFEARTVERQEPRPGLFDALLATHALRPRDRFAARCLLKLLRWPGGAALLRSWHARRR